MQVKRTAVGQYVQFLYVRGKTRSAYTELLTRVIAILLRPFGLTEIRLRHWLSSNVNNGARPGCAPMHSDNILPLFVLGQK
jgi:hypothetical protein